MTIYKRLLRLPESGYSVFLFGPRGTGKTTWIKDYLKPELYFDLLDKRTLLKLKESPSELDHAVPPHYDNWIVIDEIQKLPELLDEVHRLIEQRKLKFLLTGSSARKLRKSGVNLLAGRALEYHMHPLTIQELGKDFHLRTALNYGLLPSVYNRPDAHEYLKTYVSTYIREEVLDEGVIRSLPPFMHFLEIASFSQGQTPNDTEIAREVRVSRHTVAGYFEILDSLLLSVRIPAFTQRAKRKLVTSAKFYFFDNGVFRQIRPRSIGDSDDELEGLSLETIFMQSLRAINDYFRFHYKIYFWRSHAGQEVDFVILGEHGFYAFEIKHSSRSDSREFKGLKQFKADYPEATCFFLNLGTFRQYLDDITVIPFEEALRELPVLIGPRSG